MIKENISKIADRKEIFVSLGVCSILIIFEIFFLRSALRDETLLFSGAGDGRFNNLLCEHWFQVFTGKVHINQLPTFYPISNTLGYSDIMLAGGIIHSMFRLLGYDMYIAHKMMLISVHAFGTAVSYLLFRKLKFRRMICFIGASITCWSCVSAAEFCHTQLVFISLFPSFILACLCFYENRNSRLQKRLIYGILIVMTIGIAALTAYYVAFFMILFTGILILIYALKNRGGDLQNNGLGQSAQV